MENVMKEATTTRDHTDLIVNYLKCRSLAISAETSTLW